MWCPVFLVAVASVAMSLSPEEVALEEFALGNRKFTAGVYRELLKVEHGNFIVSPFSAETVLALTQEGARGETAEEFTTGLSLPSTNEKTRQAFKSFLPKLKTSEENLKLLSANKIYVGKGVQLEDDFNSIASRIYESSVDKVDFAQNIQAANTINRWVEENTNKKIQNLIKPDSLDGLTKMVLVNALYFSGKWAREFENYLTRKQDFHKSQNEIAEVDMMRQVEYFNYYENSKLNAKFLELPYIGRNISMVIVLPNEIEGLSQLEQNIEEVLKPQPFTLERVDVSLPKFTMETEIAFVPILKSLGLRKVFGDEADLSGLSSTDKDLYVSDVIQKAFINVTEGGTEAAAATAVDVALLSAPINRPPNRAFHADHPFLYYIKEKKNGAVLFAGRNKNQ